MRYVVCVEDKTQMLLWGIIPVCGGEVSALNAFLKTFPCVSFFGFTINVKTQYQNIN